MASTNAVRGRTSITIGRPRSELFSRFRHLSELLSLVKGVERVERLGGTTERTRWVTRGPLGVSLTWEMGLVAVVPGERIAWRSPTDAKIQSSASIELADAPGGRGTEVRVVFEYRLPLGILGRLAGQLFAAAPEERARGALRRVKQLVEMGEIATIEGQPSGRSGGVGG